MSSAISFPKRGTKDFPMPFVDTNDNVFLYETLPRTRIRPGHGAPGGKHCLPRRGIT